MIDVRLLSPILDVKIIAEGRGIRDLRRLRRAYGKGHWRKMKGIATVELPDGTISAAEVHWYEAHGIGKKEIKIKRELEGAE